MSENIKINKVTILTGTDVSDEALEKMKKLGISPEDYANQLSDFVCDNEADRPMSIDALYDGNYCFEKEFLSADDKSAIEVGENVYPLSEMRIRGEAPAFVYSRNHMLKEESYTVEFPFKAVKDFYELKDDVCDAAKFSVLKQTVAGIDGFRLFYGDVDLTDFITKEIDERLYDEDVYISYVQQ